MCTVLLPPGDNPIAVNNYINMNSSNYINTNVLCTILLLSVTLIIISCCLNLYRNVQLAVWIQLRRAVVAVTAVVYRSPTTRHTSVSVPVQSLLVIFDIRRKKKGSKCVQEPSVHTRSDRFSSIPPHFPSYTAVYGEHCKKSFSHFSQHFRLTLERPLLLPFG